MEIKTILLPVSGLIDAGPVVPEHPPKTLDAITKYLLVSKALPGPINISHHPGFYHLHAILLHVHLHLKHGKLK